METAAPARIRDLAPGDLAEVVRIDALHAGTPREEWWRRTLAAFRAGGDGGSRVGIAAEAAPGLAGYLLGEVRAVEFGSEPCGWVFSVGVDPVRAREGVATALLEVACRRFREAGVARVRTMVRRTDVPFQTFFRARGFAGGPFVQLERELEAP